MRSTKNEVVTKLAGLLCLLAGILVPIGWIAALIITDPEFSMSEAEAVYDFAVRNADFDDSQRKVLSAAVRYAHGNSSVVAALPWIMPLVLLFSSLVHFTIGVESAKRVPDVEN